MSPHRRRPRAEPPLPPAPTSEAEGPSLLELDRFSAASLRKWLQAAESLGRLQTALHFGLESARQAHGHALLDAIRAGACNAFEFQDWSRIVDFRFSLEPLSVVGSTIGEGGRFNIGRRLSPGTFSPFPALYVAEDFSTAYREKFGQAPEEAANGLTEAVLALRRPASFAQVQVRGRLDLLINVGDLAALEPFVDVIRRFALPPEVASASRPLNLRRPPGMVRSVTGLQRQLLSRNWRMLPMQYDLPSNSQVFGRIAAAAGVHGILYPSVRVEGRQCLALFPQNWRSSGSYIEVMDPSPAEARLVRIDATSTVAW